MLGLGLGLQKSTRVGGFIGLLDLVPNAAAAYSLRLLRKNYSGGLVRVRAWDGLANQGEADVMAYRVSSTEYVLDLNSTLEDLDATAIGRGLTTSDTLADLVSTGVNDYDGLTSSWYDQSLSNDATQGTAANQPQIVSSGSVLVDSNGKPKVKAVTITNFMTATKITPNPLYIFSVFEKGTGTNNAGISGQWTGGQDWAMFPRSGFLSTGYDLSAYDTSNTRHNVLSGVTLTSGTQYLLGAVYDNDIEAWVDGVLENNKLAVGDLRDTSSNLSLFAYSANNADPQSCIQEYIIYNSNQSSNKTGIQTNINTFYSIY